VYIHLNDLGNFIRIPNDVEPEIMENQQESQSQEHSHTQKRRSTDIELVQGNFSAGCILQRDVPQLKRDVLDYIDIMVAKTTGGHGCIEADLIETLLTLFQSAFTKAARSSRESVITEAAAHAAVGPHHKNIAIDHMRVRRLIKKIGQKVVAALGEGGCISEGKVMELKQIIGEMIDHPPSMPPGEAMAKYRRFVEGKYKTQQDAN